MTGTEGQRKGHQEIKVDKGNEGHSREMRGTDLREIKRIGN